MPGSLEHYQMKVNLHQHYSRIGEKEVGKITMLCLYCASQMNGGIIKNCAKWTKRDWLLGVGLSSKPGSLEGFYHWEGDNLIIDTYNKEAEAKALQKKAHGKFMADTRWKAKRNTASIPDSNAESTTTSNATSITQSKTYSNAEEKRREEKRNSLSLPRDEIEIEKYLKNETTAGRVRLKPEEINTVATLFYGKYTSRDWVDDTGIPITDWKPAARNFAIRYAENNEARAYQKKNPSRPQPHHTLGRNAGTFNA